MVIEIVHDTHEQVDLMPAVTLALLYSPFGRDNAGAVMASLVNGNSYMLKGVEDDAVKCVAVVEKITYDLDLALNVWTLAGEDIEQWQGDMLAFIEGMAKEMGAVSVVLGGRLGWSKFLKDDGYERRMIIMEKRID